MSKLANRLDAKLIAAGATAAVAMVGTTAQAAIVWSGPININIPSTTAGVYLNVVTGVFNSSPGLVPGWDVNPWSSTGFALFSPSAPAGGVYANVGLNSNLAPNTLISAASTFASAAGSASAWNLNSSNNLVGFRFQNEANGNQIHYGWMRIALAGTLSGQPRAIVEYAYEDVAGAGIGAGVVPAPGSVALLAMGALGLAGRRRK